MTVTSDHPDAVAVIGYAGRFPGADDVDTFWTQLRDGVDVRVDFTDADLDRAGVPESVRARPDFVRSGYVLDDAEDFDAEFFGMSPAEAALTDPQQRLFLECVLAAFEHAGHRPGGAVGVYAGSGLSGHLLDVLHAHRAASEQGIADLVESYQALTASDKDFLTTRVSYKLGLTGPSVAVQAACSTSLVAVHHAVVGLLAGECDLAVAGGVSVLLPQRAGYVPQPGMILSPDGRCRPFDAAATGTVRGDGVGAVLLRRLDDALTDGDTVHGIVLGTAVNNDGSGKLGFSATSVQRQRDVIVQAQEIAGVSPGGIDYVETHGTGTELGDPAEALALAQAFDRAPGGTCVLGAVKGNVGHLDAAAGIAGLIKVLLMLRHREIPPLLHHRRLNPKVDLSAGRFEINTERRPWPGVGGVRRAGVTSLGIGGTNAHVVVEQPPEPVPTIPTEGSQLLMLSARDREALDDVAGRLAARLATDDDTELADVAYTTQIGRVRLPYRRVVRCASRPDAVRQLTAPGGVVHGEDQHCPVMFLLPGQGAQRVGMGRLLAAREPAFRAAFDEVTELFVGELGDQVLAVLRADPGTAADEPQATVITQAALFTTEYALAALLAGWGVRPTALLGHSLGELLAACLAGVFPLPEAVRLVARRGRLMGTMPPGEMLSVSLGERPVLALAAEYGVDLAAVNGEADCVVSGSPWAVAAFRARLDQDGVDHRTLHTAHAFHSPDVDPILDEFADLVRSVGPRPPRVPVVSSVTGDWLTDEQAVDPGYWVRQLRRPVRFHDALGTLLARSDGVVVEVGPGRALTALALRSPARTGHAVVNTLDDADEHDALLDCVGRLWADGVDVDWAGFHAGRRRRRVPLPAYPFRRVTHRLDVPRTPVEPRSGRRPTSEWLYGQSWRRVPAGPGGAPEGGREWLLIDPGDDPALVARLTEVLTVAGHRAYPARRPAGGYSGLFTELRLRGRVPDTVVHLGGADAAELLELVPAMHDAGVPVDVRLLARGLCRVESGDTADPELAPLLGLAAVVPSEFDGPGCRVVEVAPDRTPVDAVATALMGSDAGIVESLRGPFRWVPAFERVAPPAGEGFRRQGVYVLTGGLGRLGRHLATWLTTRLDARLVLLGRTAKQSDGAGPRVAVVRADVTDPEALRTTFAAAAERFGPVDGVVHLAGLAGLRALAPLPATTATTLADHFHAKITGTRALVRVLAELAEPPRFCLLMSSTATVLGGAGLGAYAAANAYLDAVATVRAGAGRTRWTSVAWDAWLDSDADAPAATGAGRFAVRPAEALAVLDRAAAWPHGGRLVVSNADLAARLAEPRDRVFPARARPPAGAEPVGDLDRVVAEVWREVLGVAEPDPDGNFFDLGGDSMTGLRVIRRLAERTGVELSAIDVFEAPTVRALAVLIAERVGGGDAGTVEPAAESDEERRARMRRETLRRGQANRGNADSE